LFEELNLIKEISSFPPHDELDLPNYTNGIMEITGSNTNEDPSPWNQ